MKNVGRYPDHDTSVSHVQLAQDRLTQVSMTTEQIRQIVQGRVGNYVTPQQVTGETVTKLPKSSLASEASSYISSSQLNTTSSSQYVALSSGKIPTAQLPASDQSRYFEHVNPVVFRDPTTTTAATGTTAVRIGSFTVGTDLYSWQPHVFGSIEVNITSGTPPVQVYLRDSQNRWAAMGISTQRSGMNRVTLFPWTLQEYDGYQTFDVMMNFWSGSGIARATLWEDSITVYLAPRT